MQLHVHVHVYFNSHVYTLYSTFQVKSKQLSVLSHEWEHFLLQGHEPNLRQYILPPVHEQTRHNMNMKNVQHNLQL